MTTRRTWPQCPDITIRGRLFRQHDVVLIRDMIRRHPTWGRTKISQRVCEKLNWHQSNGLPKERACRIALARLDQIGLIELPPPIFPNSGGKPPISYPLNDNLDREPELTLMPKNIDLRRVSTPTDARLWNAVIARYHYLGLRTSVGKFIRYLLFSHSTLLGAISFTEAAWSSQPRTTALKTIGLNPALAPYFVVANNRFILLPNIRVKNLASRVLSLSIREVRRDWELIYSYRPLFAETFVDPQRFAGTSYLAANWILVGMTKGYSKRGESHYKNRKKKLLFLRGFCPKFHERLQSSYKVP